MKKPRPSLPEILITIFVAVIALLIFVLLAVWTRSLNEAEKAEMLKDALQSVISERGEKGLLEMAGVPVDEIHYSYEDLPLFADERPSWELTAEERRAAAVYLKARDSVVQIVSSSELSDAGQGAGVVITPDGYIITNRHVVGNGTDFIVRFYDGSVRSAVLVGSDTLSDVAVLKADYGNLKAIEIGSSEMLVPGCTVYAIGHPYGYTWSMTRGIVSGLDRMVTSDNGAIIPSMIQTDALINPGNSGGPLMSSDGTMTGLVSSIYSRSGSAEGVSFALPVETALDAAKQIIETGAVHRGWLDILSVSLNPQIAEYSGLGISKGILVSQVVPGGEADRGGLRGGTEAVQYGQSIIYLGGDVITAINDMPITSYSDYFAALFDTKAGERVDISVYRNGQNIVLENVALVEQTEDNSRWLVR
ncbi:MAG: trypsin-like peptidase domain-containing protein [Spirochaetes bacterium]|uniref:Trypsin-like peptidase domain-containing protein n=1 Tax=Candidatus Ornithospirochaeta stercoripullorum TaxID=2840899 RepID=A0A9D9DXX9_9SPIO|nr:trypsin-like peptidase domain-containing protein [Candidatus Ornithospirochaeta stercoripullorum]